MTEARRTPAETPASHLSLVETPAPRRKAAPRTAAPSKRKARAAEAQDTGEVVPKPRRAPAKATAARPRKPKAPTAFAPSGQAAQELVRLRSGMDQIRALIDLPPVPHHPSHRPYQDPMPRAVLSGGTAAVIDLSAHLRRDPVEAAPRPQPVTVQQIAPAPVPVAAPVSRIRRLLAAWADWLTWRLMPPTIPCPASVAAPVAVPVTTPSPRSVEPAEARPVIAPAQPLPEVSVKSLVADLMRTPGLRDHLHEMIREELEGEMGQRFSGNLRAVVRREVASGLDDRLTHL